ncbi:flavin reductase family protein [Spirillospora sp. CA-128828]|uniref:flavin reductase family protein n=1 Tax=Spirillospora sp. CA-128828 TaxID=3240033 RepID=UPI003D925941
MNNAVNTAPSAVDADQLRAFHRKFVTGVTIVTTIDRGAPRGLAVNAFSSVSLEPALILVCVAKTSSTYEPLFRAERFAVNLLASDQAGVARHFATKNPDKFRDVAWHTGENGCPILDGACASIEAEVRERVRAATHTIFIGRVLTAACADAAPLVYMGSDFHDGAHLKPIPRPAP